MHQHIGPFSLSFPSMPPSYHKVHWNQVRSSRYTVNSLSVLRAPRMRSWTCFGRRTTTATVHRLMRMLRSPVDHRTDKCPTTPHSLNLLLPVTDAPFPSLCLCLHTTILQSFKREWNAPLIIYNALTIPFWPPNMILSYRLCKFQPNIEGERQ